MPRTYDLTTHDTSIESASRYNLRAIPAMHSDRDFLAHFSCCSSSMHLCFHFYVFQVSCLMHVIFFFCTLSSVSHPV
ncbi:hypothetical protein P170DRAFT_82848 [Aspergillus steynii IBT 23096]|uniref:Uncharacterized protein n=1 Tax=Aspergillus steynii IBT 23096 TaxID=1392250 RepID=A0A2I2GFL9_9EURO|nr:uncharacterized protein P170DRAFT_82848 [Aspergillus steynii IBT 23096]PLB51678.1 hypothetical protein P170DRAFT_82848 [Aspergillus steynii IBT 23096]